MQKAICPKCQSLIEIDETMTAFSCPNCHEQVFTDSAIKNLIRAVRVYKKKGETALLGSTNYKEAFKYYSLLYEIVPEDLETLMSLVVAKLYTSTLHEIHIKEATDILLKGSDLVEINPENVYNLSEALSKIRLDIKKIVESLKAVASVSNYALNLYRTALSEYQYYLEADLSIYQALDKLNKEFIEKDELLNKEIADVKARLNEKITVKDQSNTKHDFYDDKHNVITNVFPDMSKIYKTRMVLYGVMGVGALIAILGLVFLALKDKIHPAITYVTLGVGLVLFIGGYFVGHYLRSKNYHLKY